MFDSHKIIGICIYEFKTVEQGPHDSHEEVRTYVTSFTCHSDFSPLSGRVSPNVVTWERSEPFSMFNVT